MARDTKYQHAARTLRVGASALLLGLCLTGCVTERQTSRGTTRVAPGQSAMPGPVARPVTGATVTTDVSVAITPLGSIEYDGQVLPIVSPDGRLIAVQVGEPPSWATLLARAGAEVPLATRIAVYDISRPRGAVHVQYANPLPLGLMLARGADDRGFLIEAPQPDGSRWIGQINWATGALTWLVADDAVNANPALTPDGHLVYTRRSINAPDADLVLQPRSGSPSTLSSAGSSYLQALATQERGVVYAIIRSPLGVEIVAVSVTTADPPTLGSIRARATLTSFQDDGIAYQAAAPIGPALPRRPEDDPRAGGLAIFHPSLGRMAVFDVRTGGFLPLAPRSVAATRTLYGPRQGFFATTPEGLVFVLEPTRTAPGEVPRERPVAKVLADPYVARPTLNPDRPVILFGPDRSGRRLQIFAMSFPPDSD